MDIRETYDSLSDYLDYVSRPRVWPIAKCSSVDPSLGSWAGTPSFDEALMLARRGWPEGARKIYALREALTAHAMFANSPSIDMNVAGAYPIAAVAAAGDPLNMVDLAPIQNRARPVLRLVLQSSASAAYSANQITAYGSAVLAVVDALEQANFRCEIRIANPVHIGQDSFVTGCTIKRAHDIVDLDKLAFCLAHPSFLRRIQFAAYEQRSELEPWNGHYGTPGISERWHDHDEILLPSINTIRPNSDSLTDVGTAAKAILQVVQDALLDRDIILPPLWGRDFM